ncbi:hypothetical protein [Burkholderia cenocepacia]|uniref:hypothetical protein n=1 Tax=Burkholderia cenocepacia TaxID=95486 RepID=UPI001C6330AB|nr:hypothetical protein [Burkholderia cenocepacia]MDN7545067.1 hypothetical protein [Burkholderia cenocepacia]
MTERPILFSGPMVCAILEGRKTQTRRVAIPKCSPIDFIGSGPTGGPDWNDPACWGFEDLDTGLWWALRGDEQCYQLPCPHGQPGDRLWVRETCHASNSKAGLTACGIRPMTPSAPSKIQLKPSISGLR